MVTSSFVDELMKLASIERDEVGEGVPIYNDFKEFEKHVQPGDIFLSKTPETPKDLGSILARAFQGRSPKRVWTHSGLVGNRGQIIHAYDDVGVNSSGDMQKLDVEPRVFRHKLRNMRDLGRDLYVLRPKNVTKGERKRAIARAEERVGTPYWRKHFLRAGFSSKRRPLEQELAENLRGTICSAVPAMAYGERKIHPKKSRKFVIPVDYALSDELEPVAAVEGDKEKFRRSVRQAALI